MSISKEDVTYVANLARLRFDGAATEKMVKELDSVLDYVNTLNEVDTTDVQLEIGRASCRERV